MEPLGNKYLDVYRTLRNDELLRLSENIQTIAIEARVALRAELENRKLPVRQTNWGARARGSTPPRKVPKVIGDKAGEHLQMNRGRFLAWPHVMLAFLGEITLVTWLLRTAGVSFVTGFLVTLTLTFAIYWNRWRVIEAFTSEFCSGLFNLSLFIAPLAAFCYSNYRGARKLLGK